MKSTFANRRDAHVRALVSLRDGPRSASTGNSGNPMRSASTFSTPGSIALSAPQKVQVPLFDAVIKLRHAEVPLHG